MSRPGDRCQEACGPLKGRVGSNVVKTTGSPTPSAKKTRIMYGANLSFEQLEKWLKLLLRRGLLENETCEGECKTTDIGMAYLRDFKEYRNSAPSEIWRLNQDNG